MEGKIPGQEKIKNSEVTASCEHRNERGREEEETEENGTGHI